MTPREVIARYVEGNCPLWDACRDGLCACGCEHRADAILAALSAAGLRVVPVEPTQEEWERIASRCGTVLGTTWMDRAESMWADLVLAAASEDQR